MKRTLFFKIFTGYILIILSISSLFLLFSFKSIRGNQINLLKDNLENIALSIESGIFQFLKDKNFDELNSFVKGLGETIGIRITIIDTDGVVLADSKENPELMENHATRPEILNALYGRTGSSLRYSATVKKEMLYVAIPVREEGELIGVIRVSLFLEQIKILLNSIRRDIIWVTLLVIFISLIGAFLFSRSLTVPIKELVNASSKVADGNYDVKIYLKNKDELWSLAESFNNMIERTKVLITNLSEQKEALDTILSSIHEGLLVLDKKGKILLSNKSFKKICGFENIEGKLYWEVIRDPELGELIRDVEKKRTGIIKEIELLGKNYICNAAYLSKYEEIVLTFINITEMRGVEKIKKDFVVNVSHELRTPLTAIKGFMETLEESVDKKNRRYVEIVLRHTERLINIVKDLLALSELEESRIKLEVENIDLEKLLKNVITIYENEIKSKKLKFVFESEKKLPIIKGDSYRLEQMFINLLENAIKYTEKGEIKVILKSENKKIKLEVKDTGIGITEEHLPRIFERFYVVDKSRSRKLGGTGLGLSIVKHIVLLHKGNIDVKSTPGEGTSFIIILPVST
jgi:two-component system phosphate regulon sensor histidine kinase PhoR